MRASVRRVDCSRMGHIASRKSRTAIKEDSKKGNKNDDGHHKMYTLNMKLSPQLERIAFSVTLSRAQRRPRRRLSRRPSGSPLG